MIEPRELRGARARYAGYRRVIRKRQFGPALHRPSTTDDVLDVIVKTKSPSLQASDSIEM